MGSTILNMYANFFFYCCLPFRVLWYKGVNNKLITMFKVQNNTTFNYLFKNGNKCGFEYFYLLDYYPTNRFQNVSSEIWADRKTIWNFKDGSTSECILSNLTSAVRSIDNGDRSLVCFIPSSDPSKTSARYSALANMINNETSATASLSYIVKRTFSLSGHLTGKSNDPTRDFQFDVSSIRGRHIILIDDVITRGRTFYDTAKKLKDYGAASVVGLFLAKTVGFIAE